MSVRKASSTLQRVRAVSPLLDREPQAPERAFEALEWQGEVRLAADRASGVSSAQWQQHVRTGLLERALVLGADHREGPRSARPEVGRRLLAHIDALAEARLSFAEIEAFAGDADLEHPGALWVLTILMGCLDDGAAEETFEAWVASLDHARLEADWARRVLADETTARELQQHMAAPLEACPKVVAAPSQMLTPPGKSHVDQAPSSSPKRTLLAAKCDPSMTAAAT